MEGGISYRLKFKGPIRSEKELTITFWMATRLMLLIPISLALNTRMQEQVQKKMTKVAKKISRNRQRPFSSLRKWRILIRTPKKESETKQTMLKTQNSTLIEMKQE